MSLKKNLKNQPNPLVAGAHSAAADARQQGVGLTSPETVGYMTKGFEGLQDGTIGQMTAAVNSAEQVVLNAFGDALNVENFQSEYGDAKSRAADAARLRDVAIESGSVAVLASGDPSGYARKALSFESVAPLGGTLVNIPSDGPAGSLGMANAVSQEAYDETELQKYMAQSIAFNVFAARQDAFGEAFFPTIVIPADQGGADLSVRRQRVHEEVRHALTGKATDFGFKSLLSAAIDESILADESTRLVPYRDPSIAAPENLLNTDQFGTKNVVISGIDVPTAPYKFGKTIDILGTSGYGPLLGNGVLDHTDAVAGRASVSTLYMSGGQDSGDDLAVVAFNTQGLFRSAFVGSTEGRDREMTLMFVLKDLVINAQTRAIDGTQVPDLAGIVSANQTVYADVTVSGTLDTQFGRTTLNASSLTVTKVLDNTGTSISIASGAGATAKAAVEALPMVGYDLLAYRTNSNRRTPGKRLDIETIKERYTVYPGPPISVQRPAGEEGEAAELEALINAVRLRSSNNAVTQLLNHAAILKASVHGPNSSSPEISGLGRLLVQPFFEELTLNMVQSLSSIKAHERAEDVSATLIQAIRDLLYRMYQYSGIQAALDAQNATGNEQPIPLIGTDQTIIRHLMVQGDTRTFGTQFPEARVVTSQDRRIRGKIFVTFTRGKNLDQLDALRFGSHLWVPELVSRMQVQRGGAFSMEAMVQPRNVQICHLPILGIIKVTNLPAALVDKTLQPGVATDLDNPYLDDIVFNPAP